MQVADSLYVRLKLLRDSVLRENHLCAESITEVLTLYNETEELKVQFYDLVDEKNDSLIAWSRFYRYEEVSLAALVHYRDSLAGKKPQWTTFESGIPAFEQERKNVSVDSYIQGKYMFYTSLNLNLRNEYVKAKNQLLGLRTDQLKLFGWKSSILRTKDYCTGKEGTAPFKVPRQVLRECPDFDGDLDSVKEIPVLKVFFQAPEFPGGLANFRYYLEKEVAKAGLKKENSSDKGKLHVKFVVTDNGEIRNPKIVFGDDCFQCGNELKKILQNMPRWIPATKGIHPVSFVYLAIVRLPE